MYIEQSISDSEEPSISIPYINQAPQSNTVNLQIIQSIQAQKMKSFELYNKKVKLMEQIHILQINIDKTKTHFQQAQCSQTNISDIQSRITLIQALQKEQNQRRKLDLEIKSIELQKVHLSVDLNRTNIQTKKIQKYLQRLYQKIITTENEVNNLKQTLPTQQSQNQKINNQNKLVKSMINGQLQSKLLWNGQSASELLKEFSSYNQAVGFFASHIDSSQHLIQKLKCCKAEISGSKQQLNQIKREQKIMQRKNQQLKGENVNLDMLYQNMLDMQYTLHTSFQSNLNQTMNKRISEQRDHLNLRKQREKRIINSLLDLIRLKGTNIYTEALVIIQKNR